MKKREQQLKNLLCCLFPSKNGVEVHHYKKRKTAEAFSYSKSVRKIHRSHAQHFRSGEANPRVESERFRPKGLRLGPLQQTAAAWLLTTATWRQ